MSLKTVLDFMYFEERNVRVQSFLDGGWTIMMGDPENSFSDSLQVQHDDLDEAAAIFIDLFLELEGEASRPRWFQFENTGAAQ